MQKSTKMALGLAGATVLGLTLFFAYRQYKKIMSYTIKVTGKKLHKITKSEIVFDLFVAVTNNSDIPIVTKSQRYDVLVNGKFLTKVYSGIRNTIQPKQTTVIPLRVVVKIADLQKVVGSNWAAILLRPDMVNITINFELRLSLWGIGIPVKNSYTVPLKELTKPQTTTTQ